VKVGGLVGLVVVGAAIGALLAGPRAVATDDSQIDPASSLAAPFAEPGLPALLGEPSPAIALLERNCLTCHGLPIVAGQRLTAAQWQAEVKKMREKFHAPLVADSEDERAIADLLARALPVDAPAAPSRTLSAPTSPMPSPSFAALTELPAGGDPTRGAVSYAFACSSCHAMDGLGGALGPRLLLRPDLADPQAFTRLIAEGRRGMPPLPGVKPDEALDILAHLRALGRTPVVPDAQ